MTHNTSFFPALMAIASEPLRSARAAGKAIRRLLLLSVVCFCALSAHAQYRVDRLISAGRSALYYEDYVLSVQYFSRAILAKPYLWEPWYFRGIAKFSLDDYQGAERDATRAIDINPYIDGLFDLRAMTYIRQEHYDDAVNDYTRAIKLNPRQRNYWFNRALCQMEGKRYDLAQHELDTIITQWKDFAQAYSLKAEVSLHQGDTLMADQWLDKGLTIDPYDAGAWTTRAQIALSRSQWKEADEYLSKSIHLKPRRVNAYLNRALARVNINRLRGAMEDYDYALTLDPNNFLAHYNRGLLRMQLGDDNRAINDFDFVLTYEPDNVMALFNRALLLDRTGNLKSAIRDYSAVINQFPNFWTGLSRRARCYRRLGMKDKAEIDEFRIFKAQMGKQQGVQSRWSKAKLKEVRRRSEIDPEKYASIVVADETPGAHDYQNPYRGRVQDRPVQSSTLQLLGLGFTPYKSALGERTSMDSRVELFNVSEHPLRPLYVSLSADVLTEQSSRSLFSLIDSLSARIDHAPTEDAAAEAGGATAESTGASWRQMVAGLLLQRGIARSALHDFDEAEADLDVCLELTAHATAAAGGKAGETFTLADLRAMAYWQRAVCRGMRDESSAWSVGQAPSGNLIGTGATAIADLIEAMKLAPGNALLLYNRATIHAMRKDYDHALADYTAALQIDSRLAEAYYGRGLALLEKGEREQALADLSRAGELGLYEAYAVMKQAK